MTEVLLPAHQKSLQIKVETGPHPVNWESLWIFRGLDYEGTSEWGCPIVNGVPGYLIHGDISFMWNLAASIPHGGIYVELGSWMGLSSVLIANSLFARLNLSARIFSIDTWKGSVEHQNMEVVREGALFKVFNENVQKSGLSHYIHPIISDSAEAAHQFSDDSVDVVFVDADHSYEGCLRDLRAWYPKVKTKGRFLGHDAVPNGGVIEAVRQFASEHKLSLTLFDPPVAHHTWELSR